MHIFRFGCRSDRSLYLPGSLGHHNRNFVEFVVENKTTEWFTENRWVNVYGYQVLCVNMLTNYIQF